MIRYYTLECQPVYDRDTLLSDWKEGILFDFSDTDADRIRCRGPDPSDILQIKMRKFIHIKTSLRTKSVVSLTLESSSYPQLS